MTTPPLSHTAVPVIDIAPFVAGSPAQQATVAQSVGRACADIGFFSIVGHGVPAALVARMHDVSRAFFDLPLADKLAVRRPRPEQSRGYIGVGDEHLAHSLDNASATDLKEFFAIGPVDVPDTEYHRRPGAYPSFAPNIWPERPAAFRDTWTGYYRAMERLAATIMRLFAVALELPEGFFGKSTDRHISGLRVLNYPEQPAPPLPGQLRAGPHTDYGAVTILESPHAPGGLQVLNRRREWIDVVTVPGAFVLNIGDLMMRWTNDRWISTLHRVVNPPPESAPGSRRQSIVFFHQPNYDAVIECLPGCCGPDNPPRYEPVTSGAHRLQKFLKGVGAAALSAAP
ncbi:MAG TPA: 2-oxoglutarate and iron-dependent oxygenase domain-containing protein [Methylomirabilota bacterium]|jgi:isopenicillin N synthase-like dioxygenase|nr:2-oxoglutarate and iron-dependent oxygenase domain-containing protein [Methylomirabilota bacterium]